MIATGFASLLKACDKTFKSGFVQVNLCLYCSTTEIIVQKFFFWKVSRLLD